MQHIRGLDCDSQFPACCFKTLHSHHPQQRTVQCIPNRMSGFEVAGIVLGSIPIIVTAIEAYINFMRDWGKVATELKSLNRQLTTERAKLYNVLDQLLGDMVPQRDIEPMLQNPMGPLWQAKETNDKIRRRLQDSYTPFEKTVLEIHDILEDIMRRLNVQITPDGQVCPPTSYLSSTITMLPQCTNVYLSFEAEWVTKGRMTREFKKFLFRLNRKDYQDALSTISKAVGDLETLACQSVRLEPVRRKRAGTRVLNILRDLSTSIYRALCSSMVCNDPHHVSLALAARSTAVGRGNEDEKVSNDTQFTVAVSFEASDGPATERKRFWDEMSITTAKPPSRAPHPVPSPRTTSALARCTTEKPKKGKSVSFSMIQTSLKKQTFSSTGSSKRPSDIKDAVVSITRDVTKLAFTTTPHVATLPEITVDHLTDLCVALKSAREARPPRACYGYLVDKEQAGVERHFRVYPTKAAANSDTWSILTLRDVLEQRGGLRPLASLKDKIRLGLAIASSVLQLSKTPWLPEEPTSRDVHFFQRGDHLSYQHPFLLRVFPERPSPSQSRMKMNRNTTTFALGIMLLEIILGSTLDQLREPHEAAIAGPGDESGVLRDSVTAFRLLEQRVALIDQSYMLVVRRCIECTADQDLDQERFRQEVYNGVVAELEAILDHTELGSSDVTERPQEHRGTATTQSRECVGSTAGEQDEDSSNDEFMDCEE